MDNDLSMTTKIQRTNKYLTSLDAVDSRVLQSFYFSGYNGRTDDGTEILWNGGENVKFPEVYFITTGTDFMKAFNIKTGEWLSLYVFRRLKFARNVILSQAAVCVFVALWHGIEFGYFAVFGLLSFSMIFDRFFFAYAKRTKVIEYCVKEYPIFRLIIMIIGNICRLYCLPFIPMGFQVI